MTHTPGPWKVNPHLPTWIDTKGDPYGHGPMHVADARGWGHLAGHASCNMDEETAYGIQKANAHLIAAAPALLAACEVLVAEHDRVFEGREHMRKEYYAAYPFREIAYNKARGAIAAAKGESSHE